MVGKQKGFGSKVLFHRRVIIEMVPGKIGKPGNIEAEIAYALLFKRVKGCDFPLVTNLFGTTGRVERAFGPRPHELIAEAAKGKGAIGDYLYQIYLDYKDDHYARSKVIWDISSIAYLVDAGRQQLHIAFDGLGQVVQDFLTLHELAQLVVQLAQLHKRALVLGVLAGICFGAFFCEALR